MRKRKTNIILFAEDFFEAASFISKKGKLYQQNFTKASLNITKKDEASKIIQSHCQENNINLRNDFFVIIPRSQATVKNFDLPSTNKNEIDEMVNLQLQNSLPYKLEDLTVQNLIWPSATEGYSKVTSIIVERESINNFVEILKLSGIKISKIELSNSVLLSRFNNLYRKQPFLKKTNLLVNVEERNIDFVFIRNNQIILSRGLSLDKHNFNDKLLAEIEKTISMFNNKYPDEPQLLFLWGNGVDLNNLAELISKQVNLKVNVINDENLLKSSAYCLFEEESKINLIPISLRNKQELFLKRKIFFKISILSAGIILFLIIGVYFDFKAEHRQLYHLNNQIEKIESESLDIQKKRSVVENTLDKQAQTLRSLKILAELYSITQSGIFFNSLSLAPAKSAIIRGQAKELDKVLAFIDRLENSSFFKNVELKYTSKRKLKGQEIVNFEIVFSVNQKPPSKE